MTKDEKEMFNKISDLVVSLRTENQKFREEIKELVGSINTKVETKHLPVSLEQSILKTSQESINKAIMESLTKYDSPLVKLVKAVIDEHTDELKEIITRSFENVIRTDEFEKSITDAFSHKVARSVISNNDGLFDKVSNELKQDPMFKAKMTLCVANVVNEFLDKKKNS